MQQSHEITQTLELTKVLKTEYAPTNENNNNYTAGEEIGGGGEGAEVYRSNSVLSTSRSNDINENLVQIMTDVNDLKLQINFFADEKDRDTDLIKYVSKIYHDTFFNEFLIN